MPPFSYFPSSNHKARHANDGKGRYELGSQHDDDDDEEKILEVIQTIDHDDEIIRIDDEAEYRCSSLKNNNDNDNNQWWETILCPNDSEQRPNHLFRLRGLLWAALAIMMFHYLTMSSSHHHHPHHHHDTHDPQGQEVAVSFPAQPPVVDKPTRPSPADVLPQPSQVEAVVQPSALSSSSVDKEPEPSPSSPSSSSQHELPVTTQPEYEKTTVEESSSTSSSSSFQPPPSPTTNQERAKVIVEPFDDDDDRDEPSTQVVKATTTAATAAQVDQSPSTQAQADQPPPTTQVDEPPLLDDATLSTTTTTTTIVVQAQDDQDWLEPFLVETPPAIPLSAYINPNDLPYYPPAWIQPYLRFHRQQVQTLKQNGNNDKQQQHDVFRYIQWYCSHGVHDDMDARHCGGLADRLKGMLEAALFGIIDDRVVLLEEWEGSRSESAHPLVNYLAPSLVQWNVTAPADVPTQYVRAYLLHGKDKELSRLIHDPCEFAHNAKFHKDGLLMTANYYTTEGRVEDCITHMFGENQKDKDDHDATTTTAAAPIDHDVEATLFWSLFRFSDLVHAEANRLRGPIVTNNYYVAAHIRTGNFSVAVSKDAVKQHTTDDFDKTVQCIASVQAALFQHCGGSKPPMAYIASDNEQAKAYVQARLPDVHASKVEIMHIDKSNTTLLEDPAAAYSDVMAEFKILMDSTCIIRSDSGYSLLAGALSRQQPRCVIRYDECHKASLVQKMIQNVPCPPDIP